MNTPQLTSKGRWIVGALLAASAASTALVLTRIVLSGSWKFVFLPGNLFLAWLPLIFSYLAWRAYRQRGARHPRFLVYACLWLLFLPNAPYIVTDLIHLRPRPPVPIWVDMILIVSFAWIGVLLGFISLYLMQRVARASFGRRRSWYFVVTALALSGLGIYIGRFLRWNSWDVFLQPFALAGDLVERFTHPISNPGPLLYTLLFTKLLLVAYVLLYAITHLQAAEDEPANES